MSLARAMVFSGEPGQLTLREFALPRLEQGQILVRVLGSTLCGSDLHTIAGRRKAPLPTVLGHEIVGEIVDFGPGAPRLDLQGQPLAAGDRVTWAIVAHCGCCPLCLRGLPQKCQRAVKYGHEPLRPGQELLGGLAEYCLLVRGTSVVRLADELPLAVVCPANCATATVAAALEAAGALAGRSVCVLGAGLLGLTACAMARSAGATEVISVDPSPQRRERAPQFGASAAVAPEELAAVADARVGRLGFDAAIELSGSPTAFEAIHPLLGLGGTLVLVGAVYPAPAVSIAMEDLVRRQLTLRGVHNYAPRHLSQAVRFLESQFERYPLAELVERWYPLDQAAAAVAAAETSGAVRIGVCPTRGG